MSGLLVATPTQVRARVRAVMKKVPDGRFVGLRARPEWAGPPVLQVEGRDVRVIACPSPLALREALVANADAPGPVVLLTDRDEKELGLDVLSRLAKHQLLELDAWQVVRDLFGARSLDRRLVDSKWIAEALLEAAPDEGYPTLLTGVLDMDTAWRHLLQRRFGFSGPTPTLAEVLMWAQAPGRGAALAREPAAGLAALSARLVQSAGQAAAAILAAVIAGAGERVIGIGLACRVTMHPAREVDPALHEAFVRLERFQGAHALTHVEAAAWADAAEDFVRGELSASRGRAWPWLAAGEAVLADLKALDRAHLSDLLQAGLDQRLAAWGEALGRTLAASRLSVSDELEAAAERVALHALAADEEGQAVAMAVTMALRLTRWLAERERAGRSGAPASFEEALERYEAQGGFVDWARARVWDHGQAASLRQAYTTLLGRVEALRTAEDQAFGTLVAGWAAVGPRDDAPLPVERVLEVLVAPLAEQVPTLLVVLDGLSQAVFRELEADLYRRGWVRLRPEAPARRGPAVAAFPTITEVSRTSLLCGRLTSGTQQVEQANFPRHAALNAVSKPKRPPVLFHKDGLSGRESGLADAVHAALADREQRVVAIVVNAVDDNLLKGDQLAAPWSVDRIRPLDAILTAARQVGRAVVFTADHGHVLERGTTFVAHAEAGERFRPGDGAPPTEQEVRLAGPRVSDRLGGAVIAPWSERLRYSQGKRHGYHGGASPAEVVVPLAVFTGSPLTIAGWTEAPILQPTWWSRAEPAPAAPPVAKAPRPARPSPVDAGPLFADVTPPPPEPTPAVATAGGGWIDALLASEAFLAQMQRVARAAPSQERLRAVLLALDERGGKLTQDALARKLELPALRVPTLLAVLRRIFNVEGYPVLSVDENTVAFNRDLALVQFGVGARA